MRDIGTQKAPNIDELKKAEEAAQIAGLGVWTKVRLLYCIYWTKVRLLYCVYCWQGAFLRNVCCIADELVAARRLPALSIQSLRHPFY